MGRMTDSTSPQQRKKGSLTTVRYWGAFREVNRGMTGNKLNKPPENAVESKLQVLSSTDPWLPSYAILLSIAQVVKTVVFFRSFLEV